MNKYEGRMETKGQTHLARLEDLQQGSIVKGILPNQHVTVVAVSWRCDADVPAVDTMVNHKTLFSGISKTAKPVKRRVKWVDRRFNNVINIVQ